MMLGSCELEEDGFTPMSADTQVQVRGKGYEDNRG